MIFYGKNLFSNIEKSTLRSVFNDRTTIVNIIFIYEYKKKKKEHWTVFKADLI